LKPVELDELAGALGLKPSEHIALVGGGGKSTLLHALGRQLQGRVVLTCTTKMGSDQDGGFPVVDHDDDPATWPGTGTIMVWGRVEGSKVHGVAVEACDRWATIADYVVSEADGARRRPFKAPRVYEPVVPETVTRVISVIGADALGRVIADQCHRPLRVAALAGCNPYQRLDPLHAATVLLHPRGALKAKPAAAEFTIAITKVDKQNLSLVNDLVEELHDKEPAIRVVPINHSPT
jgi:probable selenium-dependent hydroxylase accessory protein YqeC